MDGVVLGFVRAGGRLLLERRSPRATWEPLTFEGTANPGDRITDWCREAVDCDPTIVAIGEAIERNDGTAVPVLADLGERVRIPKGSLAWRHPTVMDAESAAWLAYRRVAPTVDSVLDDTEHGSSRLSQWALEVMRDRSSTATSWTDLRKVAVELASGRPEMTVIGTRIDHVMTETTTPTAVHRASRMAIDRAWAANSRVGKRAAPMIADARVLTISRSGTVQRTLLAGEPASITVLESRPGREGTALADALATAGCAVEVIPDAAAVEAVSRVDLVLVGADTIGPTGTLVNKLGTRLLAMAVDVASIPFLVVATTAKIAPIIPDVSEKISATASGSTDTGETTVPRFDRTPGAAVTAIVTERGVCMGDDLSSIASIHQHNRNWRETSR